MSRKKNVYYSFKKKQTLISQYNWSCNAFKKKICRFTFLINSLSKTLEFVPQRVFTRRKKKKNDNSFKRISVSVQTVRLFDMCLYIHPSLIVAVAVHICMILGWFSLVLHHSKHKYNVQCQCTVYASMSLAGCNEQFCKSIQKTMTFLIQRVNSDSDPFITVQIELDLFIPSQKLSSDFKKVHSAWNIDSKEHLRYFKWILERKKFKHTITK